MAKKGYLVLEDGQILEGESFGFETDVKGEVVFNTGMVGYPEGFSDPSYYGQILVCTYPLIGNYGTPPKSDKSTFPDFYESEKLQIRGLVVQQYIDSNSHWQSEQNLADLLKKEKVPALTGIDTRSLTKIIREKGVMKGIITFKNPRLNRGSFIDINKENLLPYVSCEKIIKYGKGKIKVLYIDCGLKLNQIRIMLKYDTTIFRVPWDYNPFKDKNALEFDTVFISNGPGDARTMPETIATVKEAMLRDIPAFGICLGHQIMALSAGGEIFKLKYGHRGQNQPVEEKRGKRCYITSQNHGYSVIEKSIPKDWDIWFTNLNDQTNEGLIHATKPFFCTQFHPEASPGPNDTRWLFDYYFDRVKKWLKK